MWLAAAALCCSHAAVAGPDAPAFSHSIADVGRPDAADAATRALYLEAVVNGEASHLIVSCEDRGGDWWLPLAHLRALGLRVDDLVPDARGWVALATVSGLGFAYDAPSQSLRLTVLAARRNLNVIRRVPRARDGDSAAGLLVNYDALAEWQDGTSVLRTFSEQRVFGDWGVASNRSTLNLMHGRSEYLRLESSWTYSDPETLRSASVGDLIGRSLGWTRSVRIGGIQLRRNFALRPDLVTWPVAGFTGEAAVPSSVDVYVNEVRQLSGSLPAGPFRIETPPAINGAGQATLVMRDLLGRETVQSLDLYVVPQLLAQGLTDYSFEAGLLRDEFGIESNEYRPGPVGSASMRHGVSEAMTFESHAEGARGFAQAGVGFLWQAGNFGRLSGSLSLSDAGGNGAQYGIGYQYVNARFNLTADFQQADASYRDLPSLLGDLPARRLARFFTGLQLSPRIHLGASYLVTERAGDDGTSRLASLGYRQRVGRSASLYLSAFRDFRNRDVDGLYAGFSVPLGSTVQMQSEYSTRDERSGLTLASRSPYPGGWDWTLRGNRAESSLLQADTRYTGDVGAVGLDYTESAGRARWQAGGRGALALASNRFVAGRYVQDEFALVSTKGLGDVPVFHENRPAGHTNADGYLLLADVNAYQPNLVSIDPLAVPFGYRLDAPERTATPRLSAGTTVVFQIEQPRAATLVLVDGSGEPLPAGSPGQVLGGQQSFVVGYDGVVYLSKLSDVNRLRVRVGTGACDAEFEYHADAGAQAELGRVACR